MISRGIAEKSHMAVVMRVMSIVVLCVFPRALLSCRPPGQIVAGVNKEGDHLGELYRTMEFETANE